MGGKRRLKFPSPGNRVPGRGRRRLRTAPTQPRWKGLSAAACTQRSKSQACHKADRLRANPGAVAKQSNRPNNLDTHQNRRSGSNRGPRKGSAAFISKSSATRTIKWYYAFFAHPVSYPLNGARSLPASCLGRLWAKPAGLGSKALTTNEPVLALSSVHGQDAPDEKVLDALEVTGALAAVTRCPWRLLVALLSATASSKRPLRDADRTACHAHSRAPTCVPKCGNIDGRAGIARTRPAAHLPAGSAASVTLVASPGSILQIAVADPVDASLYSSLSPDSATLGTSIGDRPHFQAHTFETEKRLTSAAPHWAGCRGSGRCKCPTHIEPRQPLWRRGGASINRTTVSITCAM